MGSFYPNFKMYDNVFHDYKNNTKFEEELTCPFKIDMRNFYKFWPGHSKVSKICTSMDSFWAKYIIFELKKYRGFMFHHIEDWCKFEEKLTCGLENDIEEFGRFLPGHLNVSKLGLWWNTVIQSKKLLSLKFTEELCIIAMKNVTKFEEKLTCCFKIDTTIWPILTPEFECLKNLLFNWLLLTKVYNIWAKSTEEFDGTENSCKIWRKTDLCLFGKFFYRLEKKRSHFRKQNGGTISK